MDNFKLPPAFGAGQHPPGGAPVRDRLRRHAVKSNMPYASHKPPSRKIKVKRIPPLRR